MEHSCPDVAVIRPDLFLDHDPGTGHPESPARARALTGLFQEPLYGALKSLAPRKATEAELMRVHAKSLIEALQSTVGRSGAFDPDTLFSPKTSATALMAAGSTLDLALRIWAGEFRRGFSLVRPPGHHALKDGAMGFCFFNNIAVAAAALKEQSPQMRLAIVDFDLHHGNGTQSLFYNQPDVLFLSSHRFPFYPGTGATEEVGEGKGAGTTINFALNAAFGDDFFLPLYSQLVVPMLRAFNPDMILVSAGFDGHSLDPMQGFRLTTEGFGRLASLLISAAEAGNGKILFCLEGGYNPVALRASVAACLDKMKEAPRQRFIVDSETDFVVHGQEAQFLDGFRRHFTPYFPELD